MERNRSVLLYKSYIISFLFLFIAILIIYKLFEIQNNPENYKKLVLKRIHQNELNKKLENY